MGEIPDTSIPHAKVIPVPEIGGDAYIVMLNPWMLPLAKPYPRECRVREGMTDAQKEVANAAFEAESERRMREEFALLVKDWHGITDAATGEPLAVPRDDPTAYDRAPRVVRLKLSQAAMATELDMEWDPTRRPAPPKPSETQTSVPPSDSAPS